MSFEIKFQHFENIFVTCYTGRYIICKIINNSVYFKNIGWQFLNFFEISLCELFNWQFLALNNISLSKISQSANIYLININTSFNESKKKFGSFKTARNLDFSYYPSKWNVLENGKVVYGWLSTKLVS